MKAVKKVSIVIGLLASCIISYGSSSAGNAALSQDQATLTFTLPDGQVVVKKPGDAPYCEEKGRCDVPIDCYGNLGAPPKGQMWACDNKKGACIGHCYPVPVSDKEDAMQKVLDLLVSGDAG